MDPDPAIFVTDLQEAIKKQFFYFSAYYFLKVHLHNFSKIKCPKEVTKQQDQGFSYSFSLMIEGSGSGSIPLTSGSGRPKNTLIRIRNRNTALNLINPAPAEEKSVKNQENTRIQVPVYH